MKHTNRNAAIMFDLHFQLHSLVNSQKLFAWLWNRRCVTCTWSKCQKHENTLSQYWHISFYTLLYHKVLICSLRLAQKKETLCMQGKMNFSSFSECFQQVIKNGSFRWTHPRKLWEKHLSVSSSFQVSLHHTLVMAGNGSKVFLRRTACENLSLNKKSGRSEDIKNIWLNTWVW